MFKKLLLVTSFAVMGSVQAQSAGDIAFTAFNADEDGWALVALSGLAPNTSIFFTDNEVSGASFNTGESYFNWNTGTSAIAAGTVVRFSAIDAASRAASIGLLSQVTVSGSSNLGLSTAADTLYAYLATSATAPTTFLAAITNAGTFNATDGSLSGTGLTLGTNAIALRASADFGQYTGLRTNQATFAAYASQVNNVANWIVDTTDGNYTTTVPNTSSFSVTPVPEPQSYALMLAGLALLGGVARRRPRKD